MPRSRNAGLADFIRDYDDRGVVSGPLTAPRQPFKRPLSVSEARPREARTAMGRGFAGPAPRLGALRPPRGGGPHGADGGPYRPRAEAAWRRQQERWTNKPPTGAGVNFAKNRNQGKPAAAQGALSDDVQRRGGRALRDEDERASKNRPSFERGHVVRKRSQGRMSETN